MNRYGVESGDGAGNAAATAAHPPPGGALLGDPCEGVLVPLACVPASRFSICANPTGEGHRLPSRLSRCLTITRRDLWFGDLTGRRGGGSVGVCSRIYDGQWGKTPMASRV